MALFFAGMTGLRERMAAEKLPALLVSHLKNIRYLTGFTGSTGYLLVTADQATLLVDPRYTEQARQQAGTATVQEAARDVLGDVLKVLPQLPERVLGFEAARLTYAEFTRVRGVVPDFALVPTTNWVEAARAIKQPPELEAIRRASAIADAAYADFLTWIRPGLTERQVAARIEHFERDAGGDRKQTETVVASGSRTALPHGIATDRQIQAGEPVMIDIGAVVDGYTSDLTRTVFSGSPPEKFLELYRIVGEAQTRAISGLRPGMTGREVDALARDTIASYGYGQYFGHSLGHSIGLEIHERPAFATWEVDQIHPGMVITVEPGIYLPGLYGVRTEDDVVVTEAGCEDLTASPHELMVL